MKIDAYLNLHKDCVSVRSREPEDYGTVVAHRPRIKLRDVEFVVQPSGREKCIEEGVKNVHAFARGKWDDSVEIINGERVTYDPFEYEQFYHPESERYVEGADACLVTRKGVFAKELSYVAPNMTL